MNRHISLLLLALIFTLLFTPVESFAQNTTDGNWMTLRSDDGDVTFEFPSEYSYYFNRDGFFTSKGPGQIELREAGFLSARVGNTVLWFETFSAPSSAREALLNSSIRRGSATAKGKQDGISFEEVVTSDEKHRFVSRYFYSNGKVLVVSAASRGGETEVMKRFLNSFRKLSKDAPLDPAAIVLSKLKSTEISVERVGLPASTPGKPADPPSDSTPLLVVSKPRPTYIDRARQKSVTGNVRLRLEFAVNGSIPNIELVQELPDGLTRQALFAALRLKFLPEERSGSPVITKRTLEYGFAIY